MDPVDRTPDARGPLERPDTPAQWYAIAAGTFLLVLGVLSLVLRGVGFDGIDLLAAQPEFAIWSVSGWATILWIAGGAIGLLASARLDAARDYAATAGVVFAVVAVWGFIDGNDVAGLLPASTANNVTHAVLAGLGLLVAALPRQTQRPGESQDAPSGGVSSPPRFESSRRPTMRSR